MNKAQRMQAARRKFSEVGEYNPRAAIIALAMEFDLTRDEATEIVDEPAYALYEDRKRREREAAAQHQCHYCGQSASAIGSFGKFVCAECQ